MGGSLAHGTGGAIAPAVKTMPDFVGIGAAKSGTSALFRYLREHPQIFMPERKEIRFFAYDDGPEAEEWMARFGGDHFEVRTLPDYQAMFAQADPGLVWGEISPIYLESRSAPARIRALAPQARILASLRNPVHRAFSGYVMQVRAGREHRAMEDAFDPDAHYVQAGYYHDRIKRYLDLFPREQVLIFPYEAFARDNQAVLSRVFGFLGVDPDFRPDLARKHNVSSFPRSRTINRLIENRVTREVLRPAMPGWARRLARAAKRRNLGAAPKITPELHDRLLRLYRDDIERLEGLTGLDLSLWKAGPDRTAP